MYTVFGFSSFVRMTIGTFSGCSRTAIIIKHDFPGPFAAVRNPHALIESALSACYTCVGSVRNCEKPEIVLGFRSPVRSGEGRQLRP